MGPSHALHLKYDSKRASRDCLPSGTDVTLSTYRRIYTNDDVIQNKIRECYLASLQA